MYKYFFKRFFDIIFSFLGIVILIPFFIIISVLVKIKLGSPIIFRQKRPGKDEKIFTLYKFRTMTNKKDKEGNLLPNEDRRTTFGDLLRKLSIDELPELFNILKGDMSIVGPRPLLVRYLPRYNDTQRHRHDVKPGLTGWAQVNGRNQTTWEERFRYDLEYVNNISFLFDLNIILKTIIIVFKRDGVTGENSFTIEEFR